MTTGIRWRYRYRRSLIPTVEVYGHQDVVKRFRGMTGTTALLRAQRWAKRHGGA